MDDFSRHLIKYQTLIQQRKTIRLILATSEIMEIPEFIYFRLHDVDRVAAQ